MSDYKTLKEAFVSGNTGSSVGHVNMVSFVALASIALHSTLRTRLPANRTLHFPAEFCTLVIPLLLSVTLLAESPALFIAILLVPTGILLLVPPKEIGTPLPSSHTPSRASSPSRDRDYHESPNTEANGDRQSPATVPPLAALTTYRAHMILLTAICILAVDFDIFPRSLAKCETFGVSIMDLGVGSFVFSQGIVSAIPLIKNPNHIKAPLLPKLTFVTKKCSPLLLLGLLRTVSVKGTEYPEHQTEYGTHWNFFMTIGLLPILSVFLHPFMVYLSLPFLGMLLALSHQMALSFGGLMEYVMHAPRLNVVSANKEGIISLTGYLAIHLLGLFTGTLLLPPSPSFFRRLQHQLRQSESSPNRAASSDDSSDDETPSRRKNPKPQHRRENDKTATELFSYAAVWWTLFALSSFAGLGGGVSRRVVNLPYILWVTAFNSTVLLGYLVLDLVFFPSPLSRSVYSPTSKLKVQPDTSMLRQDRRSRRAPDGVVPPVLLDAVNKNGLVLFLLANVATGLINLSIPTMFVSNTWAFLILVLYSLGISIVAWICADMKLWKF